MNQPVFEIKKEEKKKDYGRFVITPLESGYGQTLGNSLRRVLLSNLDGLAATSVKISGVKHQFQTLKGMKEDVVELVLNLKKVRFSGDIKKSVKATISVKGAKKVTAKDIVTDPTVEVVNPDLVLASLNKDSKLNATLEIEMGTGYVPAEEREVREIGLIPLDASFSPIVRVNYKVEETRVGRLTNYDKLILEIWTDGTIESKDALVKSADILASYYKQIVTPVKVKKEEKKTDDTLGPVGKLSVEEIGLPTRVANALVKAGYETVKELSEAKREDLAQVRNLGEKSVKIIEAALGQKDVKIVG